MPTLVVGVASLLLVLLLLRWLPMVPGSLVAVLLGIAAVALLNLDAKGVAIVGDIDSGLPQLGLPHAPAADYLAIVGGAIGVLLVGFTEGLGAAKTYAAKAGYDIDPNRELLGLGAANLGSGLASGMVVNGSLSTTAVNGGAGAKSQVSSLTIAALTVLTLVVLDGAVRAAARGHSCRRRHRRRSGGRLLGAAPPVPGRTRHLGGIYDLAARADFLAALAAMLGVLAFETLPGLFIGIGVSVLLLLYRASRPHIARLARGSNRGVWLDLDRHPELHPDPSVLVLRVDSGLFFANAYYIRDTARRLCTQATRVVILDAQTAPFIDVTATDMLTQLAHDLARQQTTLAIAHPDGQTRDVLHRAASTAGVTLTMYADVDTAVADNQPQTDQRMPEARPDPAG